MRNSFMKTEITDETILRLIVQGKIIYQNGDIFTYSERHHNYTRRKAQMHKGRKRYIITHPQNGVSCRRTIQTSVLVYMIHHLRIVPEGFDIEHIDGNRTNNHPRNLRLREAGENRSDNNGFTRDQAYKLGRLTFLQGKELDNDLFRNNSERFHDYEKGYQDAAAC